VDPDEIAALRARFMDEGLDRRDLPADPLDLFDAWFRQAVDADLHEPAAITLATIGLDGGADARMVLLRGHDERGLVWFTNRDSDKARQIAAEPRAAIVLAWTVLARQIRVVGSVTPTTAQEDDDYWVTRPRGSQLAAIASDQSQVIPDRDVLEARFAELDARYGDDPIPRPANWGGYRLWPERYEFWQGRDFRLHDRFRYRRAGESWVIERLAP
jgi:pyridoxamine 5'-phosphate oxidase